MKKQFIFLSLAALFALVAKAQNQGIQRGAAVIQQATTDLQAYFQPVNLLIYVIAGIVGLWGGFRIYSKWQNGDPDVQKSAIGWVGAVLFLLSIGTVLQAVFFN